MEWLERISEAIEYNLLEKARDAENAAQLLMDLPIASN